MKVIEDLGYTKNTLAGNLSRNKNSNFIAVLVPDMTNYYYLEIFDCLTKKLEKFGYIVSVYRIDRNNLFSTFDTMIENRVSVIINLGFYPITEEYLKKLHSVNIRIIHPGIGEDPVPVRINYFPAMEEAFGCLVGQGRKRIYFLCGMEEKFREDGRIQAFYTLLERYREQGVDGKVVWGDYPTENAMETGKTFAKGLTSDEVPDAVFFLNDMMAFGAMSPLQSMGVKIGTDVALIGFDNTKMGQFLYPSLSTVDSYTENEIQRYTDYILEKDVDINNMIISRFIKRRSL